jgi:NADP-dependent 3-hydroxy acid dehydrogenase YdfG
MNLRDRVVVITGAGGSIAGAVAEAFRDAGARPALIDRDAVRIQGRAASYKTLPIECDFSSADDAERAIAAIAEHHGRVDGLIHLVGERVGGPVTAVDEHSFDRVFHSNVRTLHLAVRAVLPHLVRKGEGFIGGMASKGAWVGGIAGGADGAAVFAAAKSAVGAYLHALNDELRGSGVQVSICYPMGVVNTAANRRALGRKHAHAVIEPGAIAQALLCAAASGAGGHMLEVPVHPSN